MKSIEKYSFIDLTNILDKEVVEDMKSKEEVVEKKFRNQINLEEKQKNANNNKTAKTTINIKKGNTKNQTDNSTIKIDSFFRK